MSAILSRYSAISASFEFVRIELTSLYNSVASSLLVEELWGGFSYGQTTSVKTENRNSDTGSRDLKLADIKYLYRNFGKV